MSSTTPSVTPHIPPATHLFPAHTSETMAAGVIVVGVDGSEASSAANAGLLLGSVSAQVVHHYSCPVTVVHPA